MSGRPQTTAMNGKRPGGNMPVRQHHPGPHNSEATPQHFDLIKYIYDSWNSVSRELDSQPQQGDSQNNRKGASVSYYQEKEPNPQLKDFKPFNLEALAGQRVVQGVTRNSNS